MTENHFLAKTFHNVSDIEFALFFGNLGIEYNVQQQVAKLLFQVLVVFLHHRITEFIDFLHGQ